MKIYKSGISLSQKGSSTNGRHGSRDPRGCNHFEPNDTLYMTGTPGSLGNSSNGSRLKQRSMSCSRLLWHGPNRMGNPLKSLLRLLPPRSVDTRYQRYRRILPGCFAIITLLVWPQDRIIRFAISKSIEDYGYSRTLPLHITNQ
jgi:hypothetical protein